MSFVFQVRSTDGMQCNATQGSPGADCIHFNLSSFTLQPQRPGTREIRFVISHPPRCWLAKSIDVAAYVVSLSLKALYGVIAANTGATVFESFVCFERFYSYCCMCMAGYCFRTTMYTHTLPALEAASNPTVLFKSVSGALLQQHIFLVHTPASSRSTEQTLWRQP